MSSSGTTAHIYSDRDTLPHRPIDQTVSVQVVVLPLTLDLCCLSHHKALLQLQCLGVLHSLSLVPRHLCCLCLQLGSCGSERVAEAAQLLMPCSSSCFKVLRQTMRNPKLD